MLRSWTDAAQVITRSTKHGLEFRQSTCEDGKKLAVEVWSLMASVWRGASLMALDPSRSLSGVFGAPKFSRRALRWPSWQSARQLARVPLGIGLPR